MEKSTFSGKGERMSVFNGCRTETQTNFQFRILSVRLNYTYFAGRPDICSEIWVALPWVQALQINLESGRKFLAYTFLGERINGEDVRKGHERYNCRLKTEFTKNFSYPLVNVFISLLIKCPIFPYYIRSGN